MPSFLRNKVIVKGDGLFFDIVIYELVSSTLLIGVGNYYRFLL